MKDLLEYIDKLKKQLAQLQPLSIENQQRLDKKFRMEWNYNSNHIEGNTLTYGETELLLIFGETKGNHEFREYEEMKGHDVALNLVEDLAADKERDLSENFIREINKIILKEPFYKEAITPDGLPTRRLIKIGEYKSFPNSVRLQNGEMFNYASPAETGALMGDLIAWYLQESANKEKHPIEVAAELHYKFVCIHPFDDGNGRISRLLMNYHLLKNDYPPVIIKSADKKNYLFALHEADTGNIEAFKSYIAEQLVWSYEISIKAAKGESVDEVGDWEKKIKQLDLKLKGKKVVEKIKSRDTIVDILFNVAIPLLNILLNKEFPLNKLFLDYCITLSSKNLGEAIFKDTNSLASFFEKVRNNSDAIPEDLNRILFNYTLIDFKKNGSSSFNLTTDLLFVFEKHACKIITYRTGVVIESFILCEKLYHETFTESDKENILNSLTDNIIQQIEAQIQIS